jgi:uncharacterized protein Usg
MTPAEAISSPDLVSIPNQNFVWQGYNFQPNNPNDMIAKQVIKGDTQVHIHAHVLIHAHAEIRQSIWTGNPKRHGNRVSTTTARNSRSKWIA